ncbi:MAG: sigma-70 family RNA polymerase sigma factor [Fibrobacterota bacterium]|nr:sigma-70 family RNA polymerase sigma factor [Fibrobacterota bacterium]QQS04317.1 MAG: sigma-70 family RNA polymerase sigma factor [Fibrobacterota bacterium]
MTLAKVTDEQLLDRAEESALVLRAKSGDFDAFDLLVKRCEKRVWTVAWRLLGTREDTENVVQSAFIKALESLETFRGESSFCTWVGRIANRKALDVLRKRKREKTSSLDELTTDDDFTPIAHPELLVDWREDPARGVEREELRQILDKALAKLPVNLRAIFVLRDVDGMDTAQAAEELGISVGNAKVRLLRARLRLREELTRAFGGEALVHHHLEPAGLGGLAAAMEHHS